MFKTFSKIFFAGFIIYSVNLYEVQAAEEESAVVETQEVESTVVQPTDIVITETDELGVKLDEESIEPADVGVGMENTEVVSEKSSENFEETDGESEESVELDNSDSHSEVNELTEENDNTLSQESVISDELAFSEPISAQKDLQLLAVKSQGIENRVADNNLLYFNKWVQDAETGTWNYYDYTGEIVSHMNEDGYWINDEQLYDQVLYIPESGYYYFDTKENNGVRIKDKWGYSSVEQKWHYGGSNGVIQSTLAPLGYWVQGSQLVDVVVEIPKHGFYFFEGWDNKGHMAINKWAYSPNEQKWHYADKTGLVNTTLGRESYWIYGEQQFDSVAYIPEVGYYYVDDKGKMAIDEWAYSNNEQKWHYGGPEGVITSTLSPSGYWIYGKQYADIVVEIPNHGYYYFEDWANKGRMSLNKWSYSSNEAKWHKTGLNGIINDTFSKLGYWSKGVQKFDYLHTHNGKKYFFETLGDGGKMSVGKWSYSPRNKYWYITNSDGIVTKRDKVGRVLPSYVSLDRGQWTMYTLAQDGWESGCWLRTAASGINSAGGSSSPWSLINEITRTEDPRTGMLSHPSIVNNWNLGGAYSAMWPEALVPVVQKHVPNAADLTGASFEDIKRELANGNTVQVYFSWATPNIRLNTGNGTFYASRDYHSYLLTGYNSTGFFHQEHWGNNRNNHVSFSKLQWQYNSYGKKAISYRKASILP